jgi:hypothetical protein
MKVHENKCGETIKELKDQNRDLIVQNNLLEVLINEQKTNNQRSTR